MKVAVADGGARGARSPPIIFRSNWGPKDQKNVFGSPPTLSKGLDDHPPALSQGLDPGTE